MKFKKEPRGHVSQRDATTHVKRAPRGATIGHPAARGASGQEKAAKRRPEAKGPSPAE